MRQLSLVAWIMGILVIVTFFVNNTQEFVLAFAGYTLVRPVALWVLMLGFFVAGTIPVMVLEVPLALKKMLRVRTLKARAKEIRRELSRVSSSAGGSPEGVFDQAQKAPGQP